MEDKTPQEIIKEMLEQEGSPEELLTILYNRNLDLTEAEKVWSGFFNESWSDTINEKLGEGYVIMRIQTEFYMNGHETHIYMVKMKD